MVGTCERDSCCNLIQGRSYKRRSYKRWCSNRCKKAAYYAANPEKVRASNRASGATYRAANPEKERAKNAAYYAANPEKSLAAKRRRRARKACAVPQRWVRRLDHDDALCYWCGSVDVEHVDHVHPISLGGPAVQSNEVPSCAPCNLRKRNKHPLVWLAELMEQT